MAAPYHPSRMATKPKTMSAMPIHSSHLRTLRLLRPGRARSTTAARRCSRVGTGVAPLASPSVPTGAGGTTMGPDSPLMSGLAVTRVTSPGSGWSDFLPKMGISRNLRSRSIHRA